MKKSYTVARLFGGHSLAHMGASCFKAEVPEDVALQSLPFSLAGPDWCRAPDGPAASLHLNTETSCQPWSPASSFLSTRDTSVALLSEAYMAGAEVREGKGGTAGYGLPCPSCSRARNAACIPCSVHTSCLAAYCMATQVKTFEDPFLTPCAIPPAVCDAGSMPCGPSTGHGGSDQGPPDPCST